MRVWQVTSNPTTMSLVPYSHEDTKQTRQTMEEEDNYTKEP